MDVRELSWTLELLTYKLIFLHHCAYEFAIHDRQLRLLSPPPEFWQRFGHELIVSKAPLSLISWIMWQIRRQRVEWGEWKRWVFLIKYSARLFVEFSLSSTSPPFLVETDTSNSVFFQNEFSALDRKWKL